MQDERVLLSCGIRGIDDSLRSSCRPPLMSSGNLTRDDGFRSMKFPSSRSVRQIFTLRCLSPSHSRSTQVTRSDLDSTAKRSVLCQASSIPSRTRDCLYYECQTVSFCLVDPSLQVEEPFSIPGDSPICQAESNPRSPSSPPLRSVWRSPMVAATRSPCRSLPRESLDPHPMPTPFATFP